MNDLETETKTDRYGNNRAARETQTRGQTREIEDMEEEKNHNQQTKNTIRQTHTWRETDRDGQTDTDSAIERQRDVCEVIVKPAENNVKLFENSVE